MCLRRDSIGAAAKTDVFMSLMRIRETSAICAGGQRSGWSSKITPQHQAIVPFRVAVCGPFEHVADEITDVIKGRFGPRALRAPRSGREKVRGVRVGTFAG